MLLSCGERAAVESAVVLDLEIGRREHDRVSVVARRRRCAPSATPLMRGRADADAADAQALERPPAPTPTPPIIRPVASPPTPTPMPPMPMPLNPPPPPTPMPPIARPVTSPPPRRRCRRSLMPRHVTAAADADAADLNPAIEPPAPTPMPPMVRPGDLPPEPTPTPPSMIPRRSPPAPIPTPPTPSPLIELSAPPPNDADHRAVDRLRAGARQPERQTVHRARGRLVRLQIVMFTPVPLRDARSRKLIRSPVMRGLSPIARPMLLTVRSMT